jgi:hypothetical protein
VSSCPSCRGTRRLRRRLSSRPGRRSGPYRRCRPSPRLPRSPGPEPDALARAGGSVLDVPWLRHPHGRCLARQPRPRVGRGGPHRPRPAGCLRPGGAPRRLDLRLPRHPDQQRRRVHRGRPGPRSGG